MSSGMKKMEIRECQFQLQVTQAIANIRFPCTYFFEWKTSNGKHHTASINRVKANQKVIAFNETIILNALLIYDLKQDTYRKKDSVIQVNLLSNSRPKDPKLVGRVALDLSTFANNPKPSQFRTIALEYCSVDASITYKVSLLSQKTTNIDIGDLDRSEFTEGETVLGQLMNSGKDDNKSQVLSSSSSAVRLGTKQMTTKISDVTLQQKLNRIRAEKTELSNSRTEILKSKKKIEEQEEIKSGPKQQVEEPEKKRLSNEMSLPVLSKNCSDFDSIRNSQNVMKNDISENVVKIAGSISKEQKQVKTDKNISLYRSQDSKKVKSTNSFVESPDKDVPLKKQQEQKPLIYTFGDRHQKTVQSNLEVEAKRQQFILALKNKDKEIQGLRNSQVKLSSQINSLKEISECYESTKKELQSAHIESQQLRGELMEIQINMSAVKNQNQSFFSKNKELQLYVEELQQKIKSYEEQPVIVKSPSKKEDHLEEISQLKSQLMTSQISCRQLKDQLDIMKQDLQDLQEKYEESLKENIKLAQQLEKLSQKTREAVPQPNNQFLQLTSELKNKENEVTALMEELNTLNETLINRDQLSEQLKYQLEQAKRQIQLNKTIQNELKERISVLGIQCEEKQLKLLQKDEDLGMEKQKNRQLEIKSKTVLQSSLKNSQQDLEDSKRRIEDLLSRMKQNQQRTAKLQRQTQHSQSKLTQADFAIEQYKQKIKAGERQRLQCFQNIKSLQNQLKQLKSKHQKQIDFNTMQQSKIKNALQHESTKKKDLERQINDFQTREKQNSEKIHDLENKVSEHLDKEVIFKENLNIMENQINRIAELLQETEEKEEQSAQIVIIMEQTNSELTIRVSELQNQIAYMNQRCQALEGEVELLNAYATEEQSSSEMMEINKKMAEKHKELLSQIEQKNFTIADLEKDIGQRKINATKQELSNSRSIKQNALLEEKIANLLEENEKLYQQFSRVNVKYAQELQTEGKSYCQKIVKLQTQIDKLNKIIQEKEKKKVEVFEEVSQIKEKEGKEKINEENFQVEVYSNQIKELNDENESLNAQMTVLNNQYESISSELGDIKFQLYEAMNKVKDLEDKLEQQKNKQSSKLKENQVFNDLQAKIQEYKTQYQKTSQKLTLKQNEMAEIQREFKIFKINSEDLLRKQNDSELQIKKTQERHQSTIIELKNALEKKEVHLKVKINEFQAIINHKQQLQDQKIDMKEELMSLKDEIEHLKKKENGRSTPIQRFDESPLGSMCKIDKIDLNYTVEEISSIIAKRKELEEVQGVLRLVIDNNARADEEFERWSLERGAIQEKAKMVSRELQRVKAQIMKSQNRSIAEKSQITGMLKPTQKVINELIILSEALSELQMDGEDENDLQMDKENV